MPNNRIFKIAWLFLAIFTLRQRKMHTFVSPLKYIQISIHSLVSFLFLPPCLLSIAIQIVCILQLAHLPAQFLLQVSNTLFQVKYLISQIKPLPFLLMEFVLPLFVLKHPDFLFFAPVTLVLQRKTFTRDTMRIFPPFIGNERARDTKVVSPDSTQSKQHWTSTGHPRKLTILPWWRKWQNNSRDA